MVFVIGGRTLKISVEVFVLKVVCLWGWADEPVHFLDLVHPPVPITSTSARHLRDAKRNAPYTKPTDDFTMFLLRSKATVPGMKVSCRDEASGNVLLCACEATEFPDILSDDHPCFSHQTQLGEVQIVFAVYTVDFYFELNATTTFWNSGVNRVRLMMGCQEFAESSIDFVTTVLPLDARYATQMVEYLVTYASIDTSRRRKRKRRPMRQGATTVNHWCDVIRKWFATVVGGYGGTRLKVLVNGRCHTSGAGSQSSRSDLLATRHGGASLQVSV